MKPLASLAITASSCAAILAGMQQPLWLKLGVLSPDPSLSGATQ